MLDEDTLEAVLPAGEPGFADLTVSDGTGSATLAEGFVFSPAQRVSGDYVLGGAVDLALRFEPGKSIAGLYDFGAARATPLTVPPLIGDFWLQQYSILFEAPAWPFDDDLVLRFTIPNDPSLQGQMVQIQSVVGDDPRGRIGAFTNLQSFTIQ